MIDVVWTVMRVPYGEAGICNYNLELIRYSKKRIGNNVDKIVSRIEVQRLGRIMVQRIGRRMVQRIGRIMVQRIGRIMVQK